MSHWTDAHCHLQEQFLRGDDTSLAVEPPTATLFIAPTSTISPDPVE